MTTKASDDTLRMSILNAGEGREEVLDEAMAELRRASKNANEQCEVITHQIRRISERRMVAVRPPVT